MKTLHNKTLATWGVAEIAQQMQWTPYLYTLNGESHNGFAYSLFNLDGSVQQHNQQPVRRWKNIEAVGDKDKNRWIGKMPPNCLPLYFSPSIQKAVQAGQGILYIVEGEKDVLTMLAAGIPNVLTWVNGAKSIPKQLLDILQSLGVSQIIHIPDLDKPGEASAKKLAKLLRGQNIAYKAIKLPAELGQKGDINDLWKLCEFNPEQFWATLQKLVEESILIEQAANSNNGGWQEPVRGKTKRNNQSSGWNDIIPEIERKLNVKSYKQNGWSEKVLCPFHDDHNPSAEWHSEKYILHCFTCGEDFLAKDVAKKLGIEWKNKASNKSQQSNSSEQTKSTGSRSRVGLTEDEAPPTHDEMGDMLLEEWAGNVAFFYGQWHHYEDGVWKPTEIGNKIWNVMKDCKPAIRPSKGIRNSIASYLKDMLQIPPDLVDNGENYINLSNGLYNLENYAIEDHQRDLYLTAQLPFAYNETATCPRWQQFLEEVLVTPNGLADHDVIALAQEAFGYSLTANTHYEKMFWLYGDGATGKTTMLRILRALLGSAALEVDFGILQRESHQLANIPGKRVITSSEARTGTRLMDNIIKKIVSGEELVVRRLYQEAENHISQAKIWWAMNYQPANDDRSNAIYRRLIIISFLRPIPPEKRDPMLFENLLLELPGIFNWAMEGLQRLNQNGKFAEPRQVEMAVSDYQESNAPEQLFLNDDEWIVQDPSGSVRASDLYLAYSEWGNRFNYRVLSLTDAGKEWKRLGIQMKKDRKGRKYEGIRFTDEAERVVMRRHN